MPTEKDYEIIQDCQSRFRKELPFDSIESGNAYGTVVVRRRVNPGFEIWTSSPIMCGHGGSQWLCQCCANHLLSGGLGECPDTRHKEQIKQFMRPSMMFIDGVPTCVTTATWSGAMASPAAEKQAFEELADELRQRSHT